MDRQQCLGKWIKRNELSSREKELLKKEMSKEPLKKFRRERMKANNVFVQADSTVYFLNQNGVDKWVNPLDIGNERELYPLDFIPNSLSIVPLYKTDFLHGR